MEYPEQTNRCIRGTWNDSCLKHSYTVTAEHEVELKETRHERAAARTDVTRKCELQASFYCSTNMAVHLFDSFEAFVFCNCLRIILTFFNCVKNCEVKEYKIDKHMELGLYRLI